MLSAMVLAVATISQVDYVLCGSGPDRTRDYAIAPAEVVCVDGTCTVRPLGTDGKRSVVVARGVTPPVEPARIVRRAVVPAMRSPVIRSLPSSTYYYVPAAPSYTFSRPMYGGSYSSCPSCR